MRNDFKKYSWTLWLVIFAFIGGFVITDAFSPDRRGKEDMIFIGDHVIKTGEYQTELQGMLKRYKEQFKDNFDKRFINQLNIPNQVMERMINSTILKLEAEKMNITATDEELKEKIVSYPGLQRDGKFIGHSQYRMALAHARINVEDFEKSLREEIVMTKFQKIISQGIVIDNDTLQDDYKNEKDNAEMDYILFQPTLIKEDVPVEDAAIADYYEKNKEDFKSREKRAGYVLKFKYEDYKAEVKLSDKDLFDYFQANKANFSEKGKTKVSRILLKYTQANQNEILKKAEALVKELNKDNFADKAIVLSEDDKAKEGGDYGYFGWQNFTKPEKTIIDTLKQGDISTPVVTPQGYSIMLVSEKIEQRQKVFAEVKDLIRDTLEKQKLEQLVQEKINKVYAKAKDAPNLKATAEEMKLTAMDTGLIGMNDKIKDVDQHSFVSRRMFQLKEKEVSSPITLRDGMALVQVAQIQEPQIEPLENIKDRVKSEIAKSKKLDMLMDTAKNTASKLNGMAEDKIEQYLKDNELSSSPSSYKRGNRLAYMPAKDGLDDLIFGLEENKYSAPIKLKNAIAIVKVKSKTVTTPEDFQKNRETYYGEKMNQAQSKYFSSFIAQKRDEYDVRINNELYTQVKDYVLSRFN